MPSEVLQQARLRLESTLRVGVLSDWRSWPTGAWSLRLTTTLSVPASAYMPPTTGWQLVVSPAGSGVTVHFFPDADGGLEHTHVHQEHNGTLVTDRPWRAGKPCLEVPLSKLVREHWDEEPLDLLSRIDWKVARLLAWIDAAAAGQLQSPGDRFELPACSGSLSVTPQMGFCETPDGHAGWTGQADRWGVVRLSEVPGASKVLYTREFLTPDEQPLFAQAWGTLLSEQPTSIKHLWVRLDNIPVLPPWQLPRTWAELSDQLAQGGVDLPAILERFGASLRLSQAKPLARSLLVGFPVQEHIGQGPARMHWLAIGGFRLCDRKDSRNGFRAKEKYHRQWDRELATSAKTLTWQKTANWAPDQLRKRGQAEPVLRSQRVLLIGAGALGSAVANQLVRLGVVNIGIIDGDQLETGNLSRHTLGLKDVGFGKAEALARQLNLVSPDAKAVYFTEEFSAGAAKLPQLIAYDVIIDCTASDEVLTAMSQVEWGRPKTFVSLSVTWNAEGLLAYATHESVFTSVDAKACLSQAPTPPANFDQTHLEGIGCWSPVFPAGADDIQLWAAIGTKFIRSAVVGPGRRFAYFRQDAAGVVERVP